jgi:hypothetical protein
LQQVFGEEFAKEKGDFLTADARTFLAVISNLILAPQCLVVGEVVKA